MARNSFNFQTKVGMETKDFKKGAKEARGILNGLTSDFRSFAASLIAGFSLSSIFDRMKDSALELSTAMNTLKNVSSMNGSATKDFSDNLEFLKGLADKYGQNIISLTDSYAKFTAASRNSSMSLKDQEKVFVSLTRAAAYYHMSADQTRDMMNAVVQMMSKGKVASEELRRQLGNSLPGAFNLMASAAKMSTAELEDLMKKGKVLSAEILPKFADELNRTTKGGNYDSLQNSLNKLENAWLNFVDKSNFEQFYKGMVDLSTKGLNVVSKNANLIKHILLGTFGTTLLTILRSVGQKSIAELETNLSNIEKRLHAFNDRIHRLNRQSKGFASLNTTESGYSYYRPNGDIDIKGRQKIIEMNNLLLENNKIRQKLKLTPILTNNEVKTIQNVNAQLALTPEIMATATTSANALAAGIRTIGVAIGQALKAFFVFAIVNTILTGISKLFEKLVDNLRAAGKEQERLANITKTYNDNVKETKDYARDQVLQAKELLKMITNQELSLNRRKLALKELSELTNNIEIRDLNIENIKEGTKEYKKLTAAITAWGDAMIESDLIHIYSQEAAKAQRKIDDLILRRDDLSKLPQTETKYYRKGTFGGFGEYEGASEAAKEIKKINGEIETQKKIIDDARKAMSTRQEEFKNLLNEYYNGGTNTPNESGGGGADDKIKKLSDVYKDYLKDKKILDRQLREGAIDQKKFNEEFDELLISSWKDAAASGELKIAELQKKENLNEIEKFYVQLAKDASVAMLRESNNIIEKFMNSIDADMVEFAQKMDEYITKDAAKKKPVLDDIASGKYDVKKAHRYPFGDYKKEQSEILQEELSLTEDYIRDVEQKMKKLEDYISDWGVKGGPMIDQFEKLNKQLQEAQLNAHNLFDAMEIAKIREDVEKLTKELGHELWSGTKGFVSSIDGIVNAWDNLKETISDDDASAWEKFMSYFNLIASYVDGAISALETLNRIIEISTTLTKAQNAADAVSIGNMATETSALMANTAAKAGNAAASAANANASRMEAAAAMQNTAAKSGEAIANATASGAKVPFPANIIAIAAGVAAVIAALSTLNKYANGGIVGGSSTQGDRNLARVNSGEMILNKAQQGTLWNMINGKGSMGGNVQFKIKGADLIGVINNESSRRRG